MLIVINTNLLPSIFGCVILLSQAYHGALELSTPVGKKIEPLPQGGGWVTPTERMVSIMTTENKKVAENPETTAQSTETPSVEKEPANDSLLQSIFDEKWNSNLQTAAPPAPPITVARQAVSQEDVIQAKHLSATVAMAEVFERMSGCMKATLQHQMDSTLDIAAKSKEFFCRHTLEPENTPSVPQYGMPMPQQYQAQASLLAIPYVGPLPQHALDRLRLSFTPSYIQEHLSPCSDGSWKLLLSDGTCATFMEDGGWAIPISYGIWKKVM
jgi:hypothetical protein